MLHKHFNAILSLDMTGTEKTVLLALAMRSDADNTCFPSVDLIARDACIGRSTVVRALNVLEKNGHIIKKKRFSKSTIYTISIPTAGLLPEWDKCQIEPISMPTAGLTVCPQRDSKSTVKNTNEEYNIDNEDLFPESQGGTLRKPLELSGQESFYDWTHTIEYTTLRKLMCRPTEKTWLEWQAVISTFSLDQIKIVSVKVPVGERFNPVKFHELLSEPVNGGLESLDKFSPFVKYANVDRAAAIEQLQYIISKTSFERALKKAESLALENEGQLWINEFTQKFIENNKAHKQSEERNA